MKRSWCLRGLKAGVWGGLQAVMLVSLLSGCDTIDSVFGGGGSNATPQPVAGPAAQSTAPAAGQPGAQPSQPETYPNLGTVPTQAPTTSTSAQRQQLTSGLVADNQNASYSEQAVTAQQSAAAAPAPAPAPSGNAAATGSVPAAEPTAQSSVSQTTTNQPAAQSSVSQTITNQPAAQSSVTQTTTNQPAAQSSVSQTTTNQPAAQSSVSQTTTNQPAEGQLASQAPAEQPATPQPQPQPESEAQPEPQPQPQPESQTQPESQPQPESQAQPEPQAQPVTLPTPTVGATPLAPPPNPIPPAPSGGTTTSSNGPVVVDTSQTGGSPAPSSMTASATPVTGQPIAIIFYGESSAGLSDRDKTVLHDVYLLQQQQGGRLRVVGHASMHTRAMDPALHDQINERVSAIRANAVARALIDMGVPQTSISVVAEGSRAPVYYEFMPTGEAGNRRVEIFLDR